MIPTDTQIQNLWEMYQFPPEKQLHVRLVDRVALFFAQKIKEKAHASIQENLLHAAALTHDIDKNAPKFPEERHPDACVRILRNAGMEEVAEIVAKHPLHAILNPAICPTIWEEKLLFLADKMVKYEILTVDKRFDLWRAEDLSSDARKTLEESYPKVKQLEEEIFTLIGVLPADVAKIS